MCTFKSSGQTWKGQHGVYQKSVSEWFVQVWQLKFCRGEKRWNIAIVWRKWWFSAYWQYAIELLIYSTLTLGPFWASDHWTIWLFVFYQVLIMYKMHTMHQIWNMTKRFQLDIILTANQTMQVLPMPMQLQSIVPNEPDPSLPLPHLFNPINIQVLIWFKSALGMPSRCKRIKPHKWYDGIWGSIWRELYRVSSFSHVWGFHSEEAKLLDRWHA